MFLWDMRESIKNTS